jgi:phosphoribosylglycinamide formyltransferase-1
VANLDRQRIAVLFSGSGTNLQAIIDACERPDYPAELVLAITNREDAGGIARAKAAGIPTRCADHRQHPNRPAYDAYLVSLLQEFHVDWVVLAGFMRIVTTTLLDAFPNRVMNIHPSLLPSFTGVNAQQQALDYGVCLAGATVHLVDEQMDHGPILAQGVVHVLPDDDVDRLKARILRMEHQLLPMVIRWAAEGRIRVEGRHAHIALPDGARRVVVDL